jgi:twitching motility protein PilT
MQLSGTLRGVVSQRLIPKVEGGRAPAVELLLGTPAIETNIREGKDHMIDSIIATSQELGMITLETSLASMVKNGIVSADIARAYTHRPEEFDRQTVYK